MRIRRLQGLIVSAVVLASSVVRAAGDGGADAAAEDASADGAADGAAEDASADGAADGAAADADDGGGCFGGCPQDAAPTSTALPVACAGALCDTTNGSTCGVAPGGVGAVADPTSLAALGAGLAIATLMVIRAARRIRRQTARTTERLP